jgi:hypothetical protein
VGEKEKGGMIYKRREQRPVIVRAIQFTGPDSVRDIRIQFGIRCEYDPDAAMLYLSDGTAIERGDYVIESGFAVVARSAEWFEARFKPNQKQQELF